MDEKDKKAHEIWFEKNWLSVSDAGSYAALKQLTLAAYLACSAHKDRQHAEDIAEAVGIIKDLLDELIWQSSGNVANVDVDAFLAKHKGVWK